MLAETGANWSTSLTVHLAIMHRGPMEGILGGTKTVESRLAADRRSPWGRVRPGDRIVFKLAGGPVQAEAEAGWVQQYEDLNPSLVSELFERFPAIEASPRYRISKLSARYATLIGLANVRPATAIPTLAASSGRSGWRVLPDEAEPGKSSTGP